ncbi:MAG: hypothetical protein MI757_13200, partial [Pirellulales bacterium]|nr:hypothetical protein [Pirellulales bacterium]
MSQVPSDNDRLLTLIDAACDGTLDATTHAELDKLLRSDPAARRLYLAHYRIRSDVFLLEGVQRATAGAVLRLAEESDGSDRPHENSEGDAAAAESLHPMPRSKSLLDRASNNPVWSSAAVATLLFTSLFVVLELTPVGQLLVGGDDEQHEVEPVEAEEIATLTNWHRPEWVKEHAISPRNHRIEAGQKIAFT